MEALIEKLYANNAKELHRIVNKIVSSFGGITQKDMDDFYSVANYVIAEIKDNIDDDIGIDTIDNESKKRYDPSKGKLEPYVYRAIEYRIKDFISEKNALKRNPHDVEGNISQVLSLDSPMGEDNTSTVGDFLCSKSDDFDIIEAIENKNGVVWSENAEKYLNSLTKTQRDILMMRMNGKTVEEIRERLGLSKKNFEKQLATLKDFEHTSLLYGNKANIREDKRMNNFAPQTFEKSKEDKMSIASMINKIDKQTLRYNHPLQRCSGRWNSPMKGNLISDILQNNPLPQLVFAEQVINNIAIIWNLDGKQKSTTAYAFAKGQFKISKNIRRWDIEYQSQVRDENGEKVFDENGFPVCERKTFDIRNKKFADLPEELQERFLDYTFETVQYFNCSSEDIAYHIERYNEGKPANASEKGIIRIGEEFASMVKNIANMPFFKDVGGYKVKDFNNGTINKVVIESVMASYYLEEWKKKQEEMCVFLKNNASSEDFENFEDAVHRLEIIMTDNVADMFDSKDSFIWFGLFAKFVDTGLEDGRFIEFMAEFAQSLHSKQIDGISYDEILENNALKKGSTKDKTFVFEKINHLEKLMKEFLGVDQKGNIEEFVTDSNWKEYVDTFAQTDLMLATDIKHDDEIRLAAQSVMLLNGETSLNNTSIQEYMENNMIDTEEVESISFYMDMLNDYSLELDSGYTVYPESIPTLVGVMKYAVDNEVADEDIVSLLKKWTNDLSSIRSEDKVHNYLLMIDDLKKEIGVA